MTARRERDHTVLLGLGANLGDPVGQLRTAVTQLRAFVSITAISDVYRSEAVGIREQPDFFNLVVVGTTALDPGELLRRAKRIERKIGRSPGPRFGPRVIDIDLLAYDDIRVESDDVVVPHPRMHERTFVLAPLAEVAPDWRHPVLGATASELLEGMTAPTRVERVGRLEERGG